MVNPRLAKNKKGSKMSVSLEKTPMPSSEEAGQSAVDYAGMYKEQHPDAVEDKNKAELMAHATNVAETNSVIQRQEAIDKAMADRPDHVIKLSLDSAAASLDRADRISKKVADAYDATQELKR